MQNRWEQINRIYHAALEAGDDDRARFLAEACAGDPDLLAEVQSLLATHKQADSFLVKPAIEEMASRLRDEHPSLLGRKLGPYQILGLIGSGGMGEVYKALDTRVMARRDKIVAIYDHLIIKKSEKEVLYDDPIPR